MGVLTGGDGRVDEHEEVESYPLVGSDGVGGDQRGLSTEAGARRRY